MDSKPMTRRAALGTMAASVATLAGCGGEKKAPEYKSDSRTDGMNMFDQLTNYHFKDQNGNQVNMNALRASLKNKQTTLTFGFAECQEVNGPNAYCPMVNNVLGALGEQNPELVSIQINVNPEANGKTQESRDEALQSMRRAGVKHDAIILYPTDASGNLSNALVPSIAHALGNIAHKSDPLNHSAYIKLNAPGGNEIAKKTGTDPVSEFKDEWTPLLSGRQR